MSLAARGGAEHYGGRMAHDRRPMVALVFASVSLTGLGSACSEEPDRAAPDYMSIELHQGATRPPITDAVGTYTDEGELN
ncbi:MAG: hypothetical protein H0V33_04255 [Acidimicrobiia bacterium]|jgi:hypothetical protein|nr:hypothetical protein [Acidimicrobiia bacterium]